MLEHLGSVDAMPAPLGGVNPGEVRPTLAAEALYGVLGAACAFADQTPSSGGGDKPTTKTSDRLLDKVRDANKRSADDARQRGNPTLDAK